MRWSNLKGLKRKIVKLKGPPSCKAHGGKTDFGIRSTCQTNSACSASKNRKSLISGTVWPTSAASTKAARQQAKVPHPNRQSKLRGGCVQLRSDSEELHPESRYQGHAVWNKNRTPRGLLSKCDAAVCEAAKCARQRSRDSSSHLWATNSAVGTETTRAGGGSFVKVREWVPVAAQTSGGFVTR